MLPFWHLGGAWDDLGTLGTTMTGHSEVRLRFFYFEWSSVSILKAFRGPWTTSVFFVMLVSRLFFLTMLGSESGRLGLQKTGIRYDMS